MLALLATMAPACDGANVTILLPTGEAPGAPDPASPGGVREETGAAEPARGPGDRSADPASSTAAPDPGVVELAGDAEASPGSAVAATPTPPERAAWLAFPEEAIIQSPGWTTVEAFPSLTFNTPVGLYEPPRTRFLFVNERDGRIYAFRNDPTVADKRLVLDLSAVTQGEGDSGLLGLAFHPEFGAPDSANRGYIYVHYAFTETPFVGGYPEWNAPTSSRLARFTVDLDTLRADPDSELVLIDQGDDSVWHQGGALLFHPDDGFLYMTVGDEGGGLCQLDNCQRVDKDLFSGVLRIDVDMRGGSISHPIRRQPASGVTQGYYIPTDNPFVGQPGALEEFYAIGLRSPHKMTPVSDLMWIGEVGQGERDELDILTPGANYQWPVLEGLAPGFAAMPAAPLGVWTPPVQDLLRSEARSLVGGYVYRGQRHPELWGKYVFGDFVTGNIWALAYDYDGEELRLGSRELLLQSELRDYGQNGLTSFGVDASGELYLLFLGPESKILRLARTPGAANVPRLLSETGAFNDTAELLPSPKLFPYDVASPLYSDGADKQRWVALPPGDGVEVSASGPFGFPTGSVFVKHFEIALDERAPSARTRLETRFLIAGSGGRHYGLTYRWNDTGTDAELLLASAQELLEIVAEDGSVRRQPYFYPGPGDCMQCHNAGAGRVLGLRAAQLNRAFLYPGTSQPQNQLQVWSDLGLFRQPPSPEVLASAGQLAALGDTSRSVEDRVRSYWDSNCSMCHGQSEVRAAWDARFETPLAEQGILMRPPFSGPDPGGDVLLYPGAPASSILYQRSVSIDPAIRMPPLGRGTVDELYVELLEQWISSLASGAPVP